MTIGEGSTLLLSRNFAVDKMAALDVALKHGAYEQFKRALRMKPEEVTQIVKDSGLRGHGGAGF